MFEKILFPTDFSEYSQKTVECGTELKDIGAEIVVLLHVKELPIEIIAEGRFFESVDEFERKVREEIKNKLGGQAKILREKGIETKEVIEISQIDVADKIVEVAERENVDLILIGSRGKGWLKRKFLGSVSEKVLINAKIPVLITKFSIVEKAGKYYCEIAFTRLFDKILYACDFSDYCEKIADNVKQMALAGGNEVVMVHVVEEFEDKLRNIAEYEKLFEKKVELTKNKLDGVNVKEIIKVGVPSKEILRVAEMEGITLIVMSARGKGSSEFGSTVDTVVRRSEVPVLVFK